METEIWISADLRTCGTICANVGDVGKSLTVCKAPDWMKDGKKRTRKSDKGKGRAELSRSTVVVVFLFMHTHLWFCSFCQG